MRRTKIRFVGSGLLLFALYFLSGKLGTHIRAVTGYYPLIWPPAGIGLAALILVNINLWPWILLGSLCLSFSSGYSLTAVTALAIGNTLQSLIGAYLFKKFASPRSGLVKLRDILVFVIVVMGISPFVSNFILVAVVFLTRSMPHEDLFTLWRGWWLGEAVASLVITATLICWWNDIRFRLKGVFKQKWEALILSGAIIATCIYLYTPLADQNTSLIIRPYFLFSLIIWAALRFDTLGVTTANIIVSFCFGYGALAGYVPASTVPFYERIVLHQLFTLALGVTGLTLAAAIREKMEAVEVRKDFLSIASHELRTPITSILLQLQFTQKKIATLHEKTLSDIEHLNFLKKIDLSISRLVQIVDQLLDVSRIERRNVSLKLENVDLSKLIESLKDRLSIDLAVARCEMKVNLNSKIICYWDKFRMEQVLENIIYNGIKYAPNKPIHISSAEHGEIIEIIIQDHGPGIEKAKQPFIFDRFVRGSDTTHVRGLGLGLFITKRIVEAHRGMVTVNSKLGEGTSFHIWMPIKANTTSL